MARKNKDPYAAYDVDDWQWEFLRRNPRYIKAYQAVQWLHRRANSKTRKPFDGKLTLFRYTYYFHGHGIPPDDPQAWPQVWKTLWLYDDSGIGEGDKAFSRYSKLREHWVTALTPRRELPSPAIPSHELRNGRTNSNTVVQLISKSSPHPFDFVMWAPSHTNQIAISIDTRQSLADITSEVKKLLRSYKSKQRQRLNLYPSYLAVWDLRKQGLTDTQIAEKLWPCEYSRTGGRDYGTGEKGSLIQRVYDYQEAANRLIENSFPQRSRLQENRK